MLTVHDTELVEARRAWRDGDFAADYRRWRPMVERTLAWLVRPGRRVAYRGIARNRIWLAHRAAAINLQRLLNLGLTHDGRLATRLPPSPHGNDVTLGDTPRDEAQAGTSPHERPD